jgi:hypothetical protein
MWWVELHQKIDYDVEGDVWNCTPKNAWLEIFVVL